MLSLLTNPLTAALGLGLSLLLGVGLVQQEISLRHALSAANKQAAALTSLNSQLTVDKATADENADRLQSGLSSCNASVTNLATVGSALQATGVAAVKNTQVAGAKVAAQVAALQAMPVATCDNALAILKQGAQ